MKNKIENIQMGKTSNDETKIDYGVIYNFIFRNKVLISIITFISFTGFSIFALNKKKVWEGNFEIVLDQSNNKLKAPTFLGNRFTTALSNQLGGISNNGLETEVGILESPSVLMPTFDYLKNLKKKIDPDTKLYFQNWQNKNLKIELKDNTSILKISYRDNDRDLIIPVLNKISKTYQIYSGKTQTRNMEISQTYLKEQIAKYKNKSSLSLKDAQEYALEQDLTILDIANTKRSLPNILSRLQTNNNPLLNNSLEEETLSSIPNVGIESVRVSAANEIRRLDSQIKKIQEIDEDPDELQNLVYLTEDITARKLRNIDQLLIELRSKYLEKSPTIQNVLKRKDLLIKQLKKTAITFLKSRRLEAEARRDAAVRPKGVLLKYKELIREASRNETVLIALENQLTQINLDAARIDDPWQLITEPTLKRKPVEPDKISIALMGIIIGFFTGLAASFYREKKSDYIFEKSILIDFMNTNIIDIFNLENAKFEKFNIDIFFNEFINPNSMGDLRFIFTENINTEMKLIFKKELDKYKKKNIDLFKSKKIIFDDNLGMVKDNDKLILLTSLNKLTYTELSKLKIRLKNVNRDLNGFCLLEK